MNRGGITGIRIDRGCEPINHLLFPDDLVVFSKASKKEAHCLLKVLDMFTANSGLEANRMKSGIFFNKPVSQQEKGHLKGMLNMKMIDKDALYLGLPFFRKSTRARRLDYIKEKVLARLAQHMDLDLFL